MVTRDTMIKELIILRPADLPYRLMSLEGFFYNDHHVINFYHAAGMHLVYKQVRICYVIGYNEYYQLLQLQNVQEPHLSKYNWLLLKGIYGTAPGMAVKLDTGQETAGILKQQGNLTNGCVYVHWMPDAGDEIALADEKTPACFHYFRCDSITENAALYHTINVTYLNAYNNIYTIINGWFNEENQLMPFPV